MKEKLQRNCCKALLLALVLAMSLLPINVLAANAEDSGQAEESTHTVAVADVETEIRLSVGELYTLDLSEVFTDSGGARAAL